MCQTDSRIYRDNFLWFCQVYGTLSDFDLLSNLGTLTTGQVDAGVLPRGRSVSIGLIFLAAGAATIPVSWLISRVVGNPAPLFLSFEIVVVFLFMGGALLLFGLMNKNSA